MQNSALIRVPLEGEGAEGEVDDALEFFAGCAVNGLGAEAVEDGGGVAGEVGGVGVRWEVAMLLGAFEAVFQGAFSLAAHGNQGGLDGLALRAAGDGALDGEAASGVGRVGEHGERALEEGFEDCVRGGLGEGALDMGAGAVGVAVESLEEERLLVAEGGVEAGAVNAHRLGEVGERGAFVAFFPEDAHGGIERRILAEAAWAP